MGKKKKNKQISMNYGYKNNNVKETHYTGREAINSPGFDKDFLKECLSVQTISRNDQLMRAFIIKCVKSIPTNGITVSVSQDKGNIYVTKWNGHDETFPAVVAHMDTVHDMHKSFNVFDNEYTKCFFAMNEDNRQVGVGGDDKVGVYIALQALRYFPSIKVVFFRDEEIGCVGSRDAKLSFFKDCRFVLQCDRRGNNEVISVGSGTTLMGDSFKEALKPIMPRYDYELSNRGSITDVVQMKEDRLPLSVCNIACGYYDPHSDKEVVDYVDVDYTWGLVHDIISECLDVYEHIPEERSYNNYNSSYHYWDDSDLNVIMEIEDEDTRVFGLDFIKDHDDGDIQHGTANFKHIGYDEYSMMPVYTININQQDYLCSECGHELFFIEHNQVTCASWSCNCASDLDFCSEKLKEEEDYTDTLNHF